MLLKDVRFVAPIFLGAGEGGGRGMVFNATFNNISVISWRSVLLVEETRYLPGENHRPVSKSSLNYHLVSKH